jgi:hypothetical protein
MSDKKEVCFFGNSITVGNLCEYLTNNTLAYNFYLRYEPTRKKVSDPKKRNSYLDICCNHDEYKKIKNYLKLKNINVKVAIKRRYKTIIK